MIVSHDSGFLDNVCTDIIHYHNFQLKRYKGTLSDFVKKVPSAKSYYDLSASVQKYTFPKPGLLDGVKTQEKAILRLRNVTFCYPGSGRNQLEDVSVQLSLGSRVAVLGRNGAGKSTLIKLMTSELAPDDGTVWKHPNLRIAYVAQHAFHHIEQHLDMTPNAYIQWRFASGEDAEEQEKTYRQVTEEDLARMKQAHMRPDGIAKVVDRILARQKYKNSFQYEISWVGYPSTGKNKKTTWLPRETLEEMGLTPKLLEFDSMYAAEQSYSRPLNLREVEKHLIQFGLNPEFGTHAMIQGLSGGQKVRLVIAAAMWNRPHMLVLDEPTNFLDRDSVAALAAAIKEYQGAVVMITHNEQFYQALCTEKWHVADGKVTPEGQKWGSTRNMALEEREKMHLLHAEEEQAATDAAAKAKEGKVKSGTAGGRKARKDLERKKKLNHGVLIQQEHVTGDALVPSNLGLLKKP
ncbi:MAG: P-loop containing nucleoside triphosphate hydrolase protein [Olpidium bornovanus]|uniref:P-loop containing nucleoside triphosphate hydrolase protein n=1 Tax=Olpidium bornovanus TaxID=278681 RepID=A0A8H8DM95_9FUNG|nr:MAG: P-loop containing nucleoside triphosphate hydrolase protein [Olpidium bornovanus]